MRYPQSQPQASVSLTYLSVAGGNNKRDRLHSYYQTNSKTRIIADVDTDSCGHYTYV